VHAKQDNADLQAGDVTTDAAAELLRLCLPKMSRHGVPVTPQNYATWYSYVSGDNPALNAAIDRLVGEGTAFTPEVNARLYRQYVAGNDVGGIEHMRAQLNDILSDVGLTLNKAGSEVRCFEGALGGFVRRVSADTDLRDIRQLLETLIDETRSMRSATSNMQSHFESKSKEVEELHEQLQRERKRAVTDPLTGLYNRFGLIERMEDAVAEMGGGEPPSVIMLDIDHFKAINDKHGHLIGDRVIRFVAQTLLSNIKGKDSAARYGGEEFTILLPSTPVGGAESVAEAIRNAVAAAQLVRADNRKPLGQVTLSAGVACYRPGEDILDFINRADEALYRAKREGRNRVCTA
jgi:diguanylate cyclase